MSHLNAQQTEHLKGQLRGRRHDLLGEIRAALEQSEHRHHYDLAGMVGDPGDDSIANLIIDLDIDIADRHLQELRNVEGALEKIANDTYGYCIDCGREIPYERLEALPGAQRCVHCQTQYEKTFVGESTPRL